MCFQMRYYFFKKHLYLYKWHGTDLVAMPVSFVLIEKGVMRSPFLWKLVNTKTYFCSQMAIAWKCATLPTAPCFKSQRNMLPKRGDIRFFVNGAIRTFCYEATKHYWPNIIDHIETCARTLTNSTADGTFNPVEVCRLLSLPVYVISLVKHIMHARSVLWEPFDWVYLEEDGSLIVAGLGSWLRCYRESGALIC